MKTLSEHILDIVQNSIKANAKLIEIIVTEDEKKNLCTLEIKDDGSGMDEKTLMLAANPFFTSRDTRKVGLGLSLLKQNAENANGYFDIQSKKNKGTAVKAAFQLTHFDTPPLGDVWNTFYLTLLGNEKIEIVYRHKTCKGEFLIRSAEIKEMLGNVPIRQKEIREAIIEMIKNNLKDITTIN